MLDARIFYTFYFVASLILSGVYVFKWHKHFSVYFNLIFFIIPLNNLAYVWMANSHSLREALLANKIAYIGGCFNMLFITLAIFVLCHITIPNWLRLIMFGVSVGIYALSLTVGKYSIFYKSVDFVIKDGTGYLTNKDYGWGHTLFYIMIIAYFILDFAALIYCIKKKKDVSRKIVKLLVLAESLSVIGFFGGRMITDRLDFLPLTYVLAETIFLMIIHRICLYDITESGIDSILEKGTTGFVSIDFKYNYLGSNYTARKIFGELEDIVVDSPINSKESMKKYVIPWLDEFKKDENKDKHLYKTRDKVYNIDVNYLFDGKTKRGYQLVITDDTKDQKYISLLSKFNTSLKDQVNRKTAHIIEMHNNLIMGMATMVESRDNSTGGHIKRTSDCIRILVDEITEQKVFNLSEAFCKNLIKAAPMHDLGKIAVDDQVLRKPGKFTPEEFEEMKKHAAEGARIVHEILKSTDDADFKIIAENVAHYHHERWDGSGYPSGLKGDNIPLEARIMAIADVYDALVSKRVYKESMSFEKADKIIMESFGKHFDKRLEPCYVSARPRLEEYYLKISSYES